MLPKNVWILKYLGFVYINAYFHHKFGWNIENSADLIINGFVE